MLWSGLTKAEGAECHYSQRPSSSALGREKMRWKDLNSIFRQVSLTHSPRPARAINDFTVSTFILVLPTSVVDISRGIIYRLLFVLI